MKSIQTKKVLFKDLKPGMFMIMPPVDYGLILKTNYFKEFAVGEINWLVEVTFIYQNKVCINASYSDDTISVFCFE